MVIYESKVNTHLGYTFDHTVVLGLVEVSTLSPQSKFIRDVLRNKQHKGGSYGISTA